jgi:hypothetical protein
MKAVSVVVLAGLASLSLSACERDRAVSGDKAQASGAASASSTNALDSLPRMKAGLWKISTQMQTPMGTTDLPDTQICQDTDDFQKPQEATVQPGVDCAEPSFRRDGDRVVGEMRCTAEGMATQSTITMTGDYGHQYQTVIHTRMTPEPAPGMGETTLRMHATRLGDCPTGQ